MDDLLNMLSELETNKARKHVEKDKYERWYRRRLHNYFMEHYSEYEDADEIEFYNDPAPNQWLFDIPELDVRVKLTCDKEGNVTDEHFKLVERDHK